MKGFALYGPQYQFSCETCGEMSDVYDTKKERDADVKEHVCQWGHRIPIGSTLKLPDGKKFKNDGIEWREA